jgi:tetratricopeptide (TPR) repeat protein
MFLCVIAIWVAIASESQLVAQGNNQVSSKRVVTSLRFLTELNIVDHSIDVAPVSNWLKPILAGIDQQFANDTTSRDVVIQVRLRKKDQAEATFAGWPALKPEEVAQLDKLINLSTAPHTKLVDVVFRVESKINGGNINPAHKITPELKDPFEIFRDRFAKAKLSEQVAMFREWAIDQAIPVLADAGSSADPKFEGVVNFGKSLGKLDVNKPINVEALTERNLDYWRATMEMVPTVPLTPVSRIVLHCVTGELDKARRVADIAKPFDGNKSAPSRFLSEFYSLHEIFSKSVEKRVNEGITLHDQEKYPEAIKTYEAILREFPKSAWTNYELFHTKRTIRLAEKKTLDEVHIDWPEFRKAILNSDPLYSTMARAIGPEEMYDLFLRDKIKFLFKDRAKLGNDLLDYADAARNLDQDGYAALIYWYALVRFPENLRKDRPLIEDFLYSLERLGVKELKAQFKGDHVIEFAKITERRKKDKESSPSFQKNAGAKD